jgi:hypothetical protein
LTYLIFNILIKEYRITSDKKLWHTVQCSSFSIVVDTWWWPCMAETCYEWKSKVTDGLHYWWICIIWNKWFTDATGCLNTMLVIGTVHSISLVYDSLVCCVCTVTLQITWHEDFHWTVLNVISSKSVLRLRFCTCYYSFQTLNTCFSSLFKFHTQDRNVWMLRVYFPLIWQWKKEGTCTVWGDVVTTYNP